MTEHIIVVTDLDGSLLDHHSYSWEEAREALSLLRSEGIPLVLCSSKTAAEMHAWRKKLDIRYPFIVENGGAIYLPPDASSGKDWKKHVLGMNRADIKSRLLTIRDAGFSFKGFLEMTVAEVMDATGLDEASSELAMMREFTEPLLWQDEESKKPDFGKQLRQQGLEVVEGGRFLHVSSGCDKGRALLWLKAYYKNEFGCEPVVIALGDSGNDVSMLEAADRSVVVKSPVRTYPAVNHMDTYYTKLEGPAGWNEAILNYMTNRKG